MELEEECSKSSRSEEGKEEKGSETVGKMTPVDETKTDTNGQMGCQETSKIDVAAEAGDGNGIDHERAVESPTEAIGSPPMVAKENGVEIGANHENESSPNSIGSPSNSSSVVEASKSTELKGYGLKKWRRIRRDLNKEGGVSPDSAQILKRRLSVNEPPKSRDENKLKSDSKAVMEDPVPSVGSLPSVEAVALDPELGLLVASSGFSIGMDSDNSEDRSSKSSTATSGPKPRHETGFGRERGKGKNLSGRGSGSTVQQRGQQGRGVRFDASKKFRGDRIRLEKENSQSSVESDLRSSNASFMRWGSRVSNGKQSEKSLNYDEENSDEGQTCEEVLSRYHKENGNVEDLLKEDLDNDLLEKVNVEKSEDSLPSSHLDPFVESIALLQAAQEALEKEIQKFEEIGKEPTLDDSDDQFKGTEVSSSRVLESQLLESNQKIKHLEYKLEEALATVKAKESKVLALEAILNRNQSPTKETDSTDLGVLRKKCEEMESELEGLLEKKMEAEIEYMILTRTTESWKVVTEDQLALLEEQRSLAWEQVELALKLKDAENRAIKLKEQSEELETQCKELLATETVLKLQNRVSKSSLCFFIQLVMLCVAFGLFLIQLLPQSNGVVPT